MKRLLFLLVLVIVPNLGAAEVCWFPAGDRENPLERWLRAGEVRCAESPPELPAGLWNVFTRDANGVSSPILVDGGSLPPIASSLHPAATIVANLPEETRGVVYVPRLAAAFPLGAVPAEYDSWLFVVEKNEPVAIFPLAPIAPGAERRVNATGPGVASIIGWLFVPEEDRAVLAKESGLSPPSVRATSATASRDADPLPRLDLIHGAFVRTTALPDESAEWTIRGRGWISDSRRIKLVSPLTVVDDPLRVRAAGNLVVNWSAATDLQVLDRSLGACERPKNAPLVEVIVSSCPRPRRGERPDATACTVIREEAFEPQPDFGHVTLEDVPPGLYRAELRFGKLPPISSTATVAPLQQRTMSLHAFYNEVYGSVTHGGEPLEEDVEIRFPAGYGFASARTSEYRAAILRLIGTDVPVIVSACDGTPQATVLTDQIMRRSTRYNLDIPANELVISVSDTFTREALDGATIRYSVMSVRWPIRALIKETVTTADGGRVMISAVPEREVRLSVAHAGYQRQEIEPFTMPRRGTKEIDVQLVPLRGSHGKIISARPFESGSVFWFSEEGYETERAELSPDGTFVYAKTHRDRERMVVVSQSHPLWVLRAPEVERRQTINLAFPDAAPVHNLEVVLSSDDDRRRAIGVIIGGLRVPQPALGRQIVSRKEPLQLPSLAVTGVIEILLGPPFDELSGRAAGMDFFALPQYADAPRHRVAPGIPSITLRSQ